MPLDLSRLTGRPIFWLDSTGSTMAEAARLAREGCAAGTVVGADEQTAGQGRLGRKWHSERDAGLYFTIVLRPPVRPPAQPVVTLALGLAVADGIETACGVRCDLRWPNDILAEGRKCCGILTLLEEDAVLAGIGINVNQEEMPAALAPTATSLRLVSGRPQSRELILAEVLDAVDQRLESLVAGGAPAVLGAFSERSSYVSGRRVVVEQDGALLDGVTDGLDPSGFLILRRADGTRTLIVAGGVRPAG